MWYKGANLEIVFQGSWKNKKHQDYYLPRCRGTKKYLGILEKNKVKRQKHADICHMKIQPLNLKFIWITMKLSCSKVREFVDNKGLVQTKAPFVNTSKKI